MFTFFFLLLKSLQHFAILCFLYWRALGNLGMAHTKKLFPTFDHPSCPSNNLSWILLPGNPFQDESTRMVCSCPGRGSCGCTCTKGPYSAVLCCYSWLLIQQFLILVFFFHCVWAMTWCFYGATDNSSFESGSGPLEDQQFSVKLGLLFPSVFTFIYTECYLQFYCLIAWAVKSFCSFSTVHLHPYWLKQLATW